MATTEKYNVVVAKDGVVILANRASSGPLSHGLPISDRAYQIEASSKDEAKALAREKRKQDHPSDSICWHK